MFYPWMLTFLCFCTDQLKLYCQRPSHQEVVSSRFLQKTQVLEEPCGPQSTNAPVCFSIRLEIAKYFRFARCKCRRRQWHPTPVLLPGKSHGWRSLEGCSPWRCWGSDMTERLHFHFSLSCIEGNGNSLQCSRLENPRDREPGGLLSMGLHRVGHNWSDVAAAAANGP